MQIGKTGGDLIECRKCGSTFPKPKTRGRPPVNCEACRGVKPAPLQLTATPISPTKGKNGMYPRSALVTYLEENDFPVEAQNVAELLRSL